MLLKAPQKVLEMSIRLTRSLVIADQEVTFEFARSSGPGGQNVNKVSTQVTLCFDLADSPSLTPSQKRILRGDLRTRINRDGILRVTSRKHRTQVANRRAARERFVELVAEALRPRKRRIKTKVPRAAREKRLQLKRMLGEKKRSRRRVHGE